MLSPEQVARWERVIQYWHGNQDTQNAILEKIREAMREADFQAAHRLSKAWLERP